MKIKNILLDHGQGLCFLLATTIALLLSERTITIPISPAEDGQGYAIRGFTLYGYMHSGQWAQFWTLLRHPNQSICPLHYLPFFAIPQALAGIAAYTLSQNLVVYLLLAAATFKLCQTLDRAEWAPAIFLLCAANNLALTDYYFFYLDMEFFAAGLFAVACQLAAWREASASKSILSGLALGLPFWIKPANALIFIAVFALSEIIRAAGNLLACKAPADRSRSLAASAHHWICQGVGFIPLLVLALYCGGAQSILQLIQSNEINNTTTPLNCEFLLRLFYFPLCLSYFYHVLLLGSILLAVFLLGKNRMVTEDRETAAFAARLFLPLIFAYIVWGAFFSFWMQAKAIRSLLPMLPLFWIALFWLIERRRLRTDLLFLVAGMYAFTAFSQKAFDLLGTKSSYVDDTYQLNLDSWMQMPSPWHEGGFNMAIADGLSKNPPPPGIICTNSIELQKDLTWRLNSGDLLLGKPPRYDVHLIFIFNGTYLNRTFVGAHLIVFKRWGPQSDKVRDESLDMLQYGIDEWVTKQHCAKPGELTDTAGEPICYLFLFPSPLTQAQVDSANKSKPFSNMAQENDDGSVPVSGHHFSRAEAWNLIKTWLSKRFGHIP